MKTNTAVCPKCSGSFASKKIIIPGGICPGCRTQREAQKEVMPRSLTTVRGVYECREGEYRVYVTYIGNGWYLIATACTAFQTKDPAGRSFLTPGEQFQKVGFNERDAERYQLAVKEALEL